MITLLTLGLSLSFRILDLPSIQAFEVITSDAKQCNWMNIRVSGEDAITPYRALMVPLGPLPLSNVASRIYEVPFSGPNYYSVDGYIRYPVGTEVLPLVSVISIALLDTFVPSFGRGRCWRILSRG